MACLRGIVTYGVEDVDCCGDTSFVAKVTFVITTTYYREGGTDTDDNDIVVTSSSFASRELAESNLRRVMHGGAFDDRLVATYEAARTHPGYGAYDPALTDGRIRFEFPSDGLGDDYPDDEPDVFACDETETEPEGNTP